MATYDFTVTGTLEAEDEQDARRQIVQRIRQGAPGMGDMVTFDLATDELKVVAV